MSNYPTLENFFAAYFHQDWAMEQATPDAVVDGYRAGETPEQVARARADAGTLLAEGLDDAALGARIRAMGCEYDPTRDGMAWGDWLHGVARRLEGPGPAPRP